MTTNAFGPDWLAWVAAAAVPVGIIGGIIDDYLRFHPGRYPYTHKVDDLGPEQRREIERMLAQDVHPRRIVRKQREFRAKFKDRV